jgi:hypothetical protein
VIARTATDTTADLVRGKSVEKLVVVPAQPVQTSENAGGMLKTVSDVVAGNVDDVVK